MLGGGGGGGGGVLNYLYLSNFDKALKVTWVRRIIKGEEGWSIFPFHFKIHKIFLFGDIFLNNIYKECTNNFWKDVIDACRSLYDNIWLLHSPDRSAMPQWYNTKLCNYFNKDWYNKGITCVNDLLCNGNFISIENLCQRRNVKCYFLEYESIKHKIQIIHTFRHKVRVVGPILPIMLDKINLSVKGCNQIYRIIQKNSEQVINEVKEKWENILNDNISTEDIKSAFKISQKLPICVFNRYTQFKILHNRLNTKQLLFKMKISDSEDCPDTTLHALINCPISAQLWRCVELWLRANVNKGIKISDKEKILGFLEDKRDRFIVNISILNTKIIIYRMRQDFKQINLLEVLRLLYKEMKADYYENEVNPEKNQDDGKLGKCERLLCSIFEK